MNIKLRPHHMLSLKRFIAEKQSLEYCIEYNKSIGYPEEHTVNAYNILKRISEDNCKVEIVKGFDGICEICEKKGSENCPPVSIEKHLARQYHIKIRKTYPSKYIVEAALKS